jgi:hypothetical protein
MILRTVGVNARASKGPTQVDSSLVSNSGWSQNHWPSMDPTAVRVGEPPRSRASNSAWSQNHWPSMDPTAVIRIMLNVRRQKKKKRQNSSHSGNLLGKIHRRINNSLLNFSKVGKLELSHWYTFKKKLFGLRLYLVSICLFKPHQVLPEQFQLLRRIVTLVFLSQFFFLNDSLHCYFRWSLLY